MGIGQRQGRWRIIAGALASGLLGVWLSAPASAQTAVRLPALHAQAERVTVSGLSSGAYMAEQFAVAHSARVAGVGVFAGGPYYCVGINMTRAEGVCMQGDPGADGSIRDAERLARLRLVDDTQHLRTQRAWLLAGDADRTVVTTVVRSAADFHRYYNANGVHFEEQHGLGHGLPTVAQGVACATTGPPFINRCGTDRVAHMLALLDAGGGAPSTTTAAGRLIAFEQSEFVGRWRRWWDLSSMADTGYVYVPAQCEKTRRCRVHVALHGCRQGTAAIGEAFVRDTGYNEWAARHDLIVLYPQVQPSEPTMFAWWRPFNPNGCWDWWGYTGTDYAVKPGVQINAIAAMLDRLAEKRCVGLTWGPGLRGAT